jgi:hypothetical protein
MASNKQHTPSGEGSTKYSGRVQKRKRSVVEETDEEAEDLGVEEQQSSRQASPEEKKRGWPKQVIRGGIGNGKGRISTKLTGVGLKNGAQLRSATPEEEQEEDSGRDTSSPKNTSETRLMRKRGGDSTPNVVRKPVKPPPGAAVTKKRVVAKEPQPKVEDDEFEVPEGAYDSVWDSEDERGLRKYWTREHDVILNHTQAHEASLWKKTYQVFGLAPPELLPSHIALDNSEKKGVPDPGNEELESDEVLVNKNWAPDTCLILCGIVCCPAFKGRVDYLRYVLAYALYLRIGSSEEFPKPYKVDYLVSGRQQLADEIARISEEVKAEDVLAAMKTIQWTEQPPHHRFLDILRIQVRGSKRKVETKALIRQDLAAIVKAWDTYAEELDSGLDLKHMADYAKAWNTKHPISKDDPKLPGEKYSTPAMLRLKKEYIISKWRESNKQLRRQSPGNGRRMVAQGPDGALQQQPEGETRVGFIKAESDGR